MANNWKMTRDSVIDSAVFPEGEVFATKDIPTVRRELWLELGLIIETTEDVTEGAAAKTRAAMKEHNDAVKARQKAQADAKERAGMNKSRK